MFVDILPDGPEDDGIAYLSFFVEEKEDGSLEVAGEKTTTEAVLADVKQELEDLRQFMDIGEGSVVVDETEDIDWINNWKQYFHQFYIDDILVIPSWENIKPEDTDKMVLHIDPGTAFGTGMHETTQLCIRQLRKFITPETELLDVGTGSGILAILSLMFGAKHAVGVVTDIVGCRAAEGEHSGSNILATVVCPQLPACHKRCVLTPSTLYGMDSVTVSDSQNDPFSREQIGISCEELRHGPLVIHHVDPLGCPLHCKVFCHLVGFRLLAILRRHMSRDLHIGEISVQFL